QSPFAWMWKPWTLSGFSPLICPLMWTPLPVVANVSWPETSLPLVAFNVAWARVSLAGSCVIDEWFAMDEAVADGATDEAMAEVVDVFGAALLLLLHPASRAIERAAKSILARGMVHLRHGGNASSLTNRA